MHNEFSNRRNIRYIDRRDAAKDARIKVQYTYKLISTNMNNSMLKLSSSNSGWLNWWQKLKFIHYYNYNYIADEISVIFKRNCNYIYGMQWKALNSIYIPVITMKQWFIDFNIGKFS